MSHDNIYGLDELKRFGADTSESKVNDELALGDRAYDTDSGTETNGTVVDLPDETAAEFSIEGLGKTVAQVNADYPATDPVVGIEFDRGGRTYHYPESRLKPLPDGWEPKPAKSEGERKRERIADEYPEAIEAFVTLAADVADDPRRTRDHLQIVFGWWGDGELPDGPDNALRNPQWSNESAIPIVADAYRDHLITFDHGGDYPAKQLYQDMRRFDEGTGVVRLAWKSTMGGVVGYNYSRALAYLHDRGLDDEHPEVFGQ